MGLTTPLALIGLVLVGVPIVAHLLRRADVRVLRLPTVTFLARAAVESRRRPRVVDPLLLAIRIAAVVLAVLALAAPFTEHPVSFGDGRIGSVILVIDDSMSMGQRVDGTSLLAQAQNRAAQIIESLPEGSEVGLVYAGSPARVTFARTRELPSVLSALRAGADEGTARAGDLEQALTLAQRQLAGARHANRRIVVLSDFRGIEGEEPTLASDRVVFERVGDERELSNVAITSASVESRDGQSRVAVSVRAWGTTLPDRVTVRLLRGTTELARGEVVFDGATGMTTLLAPETGLEADPTATLEIDAPSWDALSADDRRGVLLRPPSAPRVVLIDRLGASATRFVERALTLAPREAGGPIAVRRMDARSLPSLTVGSADVIVVADVDLRDTEVAESIRAHVEDGAGLLVVAGPHAGPGSETRLEDLLPARITAEAGAIDGLVREPASALLPPGAAPDAALASVRIRQRVSLEASDEGEVALRFTDGAPAMIADPSRRTAVLATGIDDAWSDLPFRPVFLPLMVRTVVGLSRPGTMPDEPFAAGALNELRGPSEARSLSVRGPDGFVTELETSAGVAHLDGLSLAGAYSVSFELSDGRALPSPRSAFVLAAPGAESDLGVRPLPESAAPSDDESAGPVLVRSSFGPWLFLLVGLLCLGEGALRLRGQGLASA